MNRRPQPGSAVCRSGVSLESNNCPHRGTSSLAISMGRGLTISKLVKPSRRRMQPLFSLSVIEAQGF
jgi:hypothetical protein